MASNTLEVTGHNGQLELTDTVLRIKRKGAFAFLTQGLKGDKEIKLSQLSSVQFRKTTLFTNGYIQFSFVGGQEAKGGVLEAGQDENTVLFRPNQQTDFEAFRDEVQRRMALPAQGAVVKPTSSFDEIEKLGLLRDKGLVTEEEFQQKKRQLLGM